MRGEREQMLNAGYRPGLRGDATPSTPSTASTTVRQNPLMYQRMHSSDSDKEKNSDWLDGLSEQKSVTASSPSKFTKSTSPKRKWISGLPSGGRMQPMQNKREIVATKPNENSTRRASASAMSARRPPLPSSIGHRSQSLDELLDSSESKANDDTPATERASEHNESTTSGSENMQTESQQPPKTGSYTNDNRLNDTSDSVEPPRRPSRSERSRSVGVDSETSSNRKNETENRLNCSETNSIGSTSSLNSAINQTPNPLDDANSANNQDVQSTCSQQDSMGSQSSDKKRNLLNRYVKKVKSLIKK